MQYVILKYSIFWIPNLFSVIDTAEITRCCYENKDIESLNCIIFIWKTQGYICYKFTIERLIYFRIHNFICFLRFFRRKKLAEIDLRWWRAIEDFKLKALSSHDNEKFHNISSKTMNRSRSFCGLTYYCSYLILYISYFRWNVTNSKREEMPVSTNSKQSKIVRDLLSQVRMRKNRESLLELNFSIQKGLSLC